jgi:plasmid stabilization system protein ParE
VNLLEPATGFVEIYESASRVARFPELGFRYKGAREVRILLRDQYRIAYLIKSSTEIDILRVFHGALEIERYLA